MENKRTNEVRGSERTKCEVYSRICGYIRPTSTWNEGKLEEYYDRKEYKN